MIIETDISNVSKFISTGSYIPEHFTNINYKKYEYSIEEIKAIHDKLQINIENIANELYSYNDAMRKKIISTEGVFKYKKKIIEGKKTIVDDVNFIKDFNYILDIQSEYLNTAKFSKDDLCTLTNMIRNNFFQTIKSIDKIIQDHEVKISACQKTEHNFKWCKYPNKYYLIIVDEQKVDVIFFFEGITTFVKYMSLYNLKILNYLKYNLYLDLMDMLNLLPDKTLQEQIGVLDFNKRLNEQLFDKKEKLIEDSISLMSEVNSQENLKNLIRLTNSMLIVNNNLLILNQNYYKIITELCTEMRFLTTKDVKSMEPVELEGYLLDYNNPYSVPNNYVANFMKRQEEREKLKLNYENLKNSYNNSSFFAFEERRIYDISPLYNNLTQIKLLT